MSTSDETIRLVIFGEPCSKANSRKLVTIRGKTAFIKSEKALAYRQVFLAQSRVRPLPLFEQDVEVYLKIFYASRRPDLDESLILDLLQEARVYANDRQVKRKVVEWGLDRATPRSIIEVKPLIV